MVALIKGDRVRDRIKNNVTGTTSVFCDSVDNFDEIKPAIITPVIPLFIFFCARENFMLIFFIDSKNFYFDCRGDIEMLTGLNDYPATRQ